MTTDQIKKMATQVMATAADNLHRHGELAQSVIVFMCDNKIKIYECDGSVTNDPAAKSLLADMLRDLIAAGGVEAVLHITDSWYAHISAENAKIKKRNRWNVEQAAAHGLCEKVEAIAVMVQSPIYSLLLRQPYRREGGTIIVEGPPETADSIGYEFGSAEFPSVFGQLFPRIPENKPQ